MSNALSAEPPPPSSAVDAINRVIFVGDRVGDAVGETGGERDGLDVGEFVGDIDGEIVGEILGGPVGEVVGELVGKTVGDAVDELVNGSEDEIEQTHPVLCRSHHPSFQLVPPLLAGSTKTQASPPKVGSDGLQLVYVLLQSVSVHAQVPFSSARPIHCAAVPRQAWPFTSSRMKVFSALLSIHAGLPGAHTALHSPNVRLIPITAKHFPLSL